MEPDSEFPQYGKFIVIEGLDGAGTTTQTMWLTKWMHQHGYDHARDWEPTNDPIGTLIRRQLTFQSELSPAEDLVDRASQRAALALLFAADRANHGINLRKWLSLGLHVVCDRYFLSSLAYQTSVLSTEDWIKSINATMVRPDLTIFLDVPVETCLERLKTRKTREFFENTEDLERADRNYRRFWHRKDLVGPAVSIDGTGTIDEVHNAIVEAVLPLLAPKLAAEKRVSA